MLAKVIRHIFLVCILPLLCLYGLEFILDYFGLLSNITQDVLLLIRVGVIIFLCIRPLPKELNSGTEMRVDLFPGRKKVFSDIKNFGRFGKKNQKNNKQ